MRALGVAVPVLAAALLVAGCGSTKHSLDPVATAATKTAARGGTFRIEVEFAKSKGYAGTGAFDADGNFDLQLNYSGMAVEALAVANDAGHLVMHIKSPALAGQLSDERSWAAVDMTRLGPKTLGAVQSPGSDVTHVLTMLSRVATDVRTAGAGTVAGVHATHYRADLDLAKAAREQGLAGSEAQQIRRKAAAQSIPVDVWIDDAGYVRKIDEHIDAKPKAEAGDRVSFTFTGIGGQASIEAPPRDATQDVTDRFASR